MSNNTASVLSVRDAVALAKGKGKVTAGQVDRIKATVGASFFFEGMAAYAVSTRGIVSYADGAASLTALAKDTLREGQKVEARRSALSKLSTATGLLLRTGVPVTVDNFEAVRLAYDSTKDGRAMLAKAVEAAEKEANKEAALAALLVACQKAKDAKAAERKRADAAKAEEAAKKAANAKAEGKKKEEEEAKAVTVKVTWLQALAGVADAAPGNVPALDSSALAKANALHAAIGKALEEANGNMRAALATASAARKASNAKASTAKASTAPVK